MSAITDMVQQHLGDNGVAQIAQHLGVDPATARGQVPSSMPWSAGLRSDRSRCP